jgi:hypothetical protein
VSQEIERRGDGWAVRALTHGGEPLAGATFQVLRPGAPAAVVREGRTPADGWVELAPDVPGEWQVRIVDRTGHGRTIAVDVPEVQRPPTVTSTSTSTPTSTPNATGDGPGPLRIAAGAAAILAVFLALAALRRRRARGA